jgi:hypothetical protein
MTVFSNPLYFSLFARLKIKPKRRHIFFGTEVIEAESQVVLNTHTEQEFQDAFKMVEDLGTVHTRGMGLDRR